MPAIGFKHRFADPIRAGRKTHTIRAKVPAGFRLGHWAPLYSGMRTANCTLIGSAMMARLSGVRLDLDAGTVEAPVNGYPLTHVRDLDEFAWRDGFEDWDDMVAFWTVTHPGVRQFTGVMLGWSRFALDRRLGAEAREAA